VAAPLRATYRLQLGPGFGFDDAAVLADYLAELGVSHVYLSPVLQAAPGSTHGYDVVDPGRVSQELGGAEGFARLRQACAARGMGVIVDVVPNHMSIASTANAWWWDVIENGPSSRFAAHFDVDWAPGAGRRENRVLLPILGERYHDAVEGRLVRLERRGGAFVVRYREHVLPMAPRSVDWVLRRAAAGVGSDELMFLAGAAAALPRPTQTDRASVARRHRDKTVIVALTERLLAREPAIAAAVDGVLEEIGADPDQLDAVLERQNFRLVYWRNAASELGYRRFFDVHSLIGLRMEDPQVFEDTHHLVLGWLRAGTIDGVRIDHPDGLSDPEGYLASLRAAAPSAWIVVEKILAPGEPLPERWPVDGTTGYDFLALVDAVLRDGEGAAPLAALAARFTGGPQHPDAVARAAKLEVLRTSLGSELVRLRELWLAGCRRERRGRDVTAQELNEVLAATLCAFDVYRTYVRPGMPAAPRDEAAIRAAVARARAEHGELDGELFDWLESILLGRGEHAHERELAQRFQQVSGALMAKGVEDTAFYRDVRLIACNEVGGGPGFFAASAEDFHRAMAAPGRARTMLATSTHDTKRGEDVRARLAVLSELPDAWADAVGRWNERASRHRAAGAPDDTDVYFFWQTLCGAWPVDAERLGAAMLKSVREAKRRTSWTTHDAAYEAALAGFVAGVLADAALVADVSAFVARLGPATQTNILARTLLKLTAPGVPDLYQGSELLDRSLVDPDNRRPVDFARRRRLVAEVRHVGPEAALAAAGDGLAKLWLTQRVLALRARAPDAFAGEYRPLAARGARAAHVLAFARGDALVTVVPRLTVRLRGQGGAWLWDDTALELPGGPWRNALTGEPVGWGRVPLPRLLARFPVALLTRGGGAV
jgi:(1->4)-alpha-D-glucan 1-alpha-D-glucosylmutase